MMIVLASYYAHVEQSADSFDHHSSASDEVRRCFRLIKRRDTTSLVIVFARDLGACDCDPSVPGAPVGCGSAHPTNLVFQTIEVAQAGFAQVPDSGLAHRATFTSSTTHGEFIEVRSVGATNPQLVLERRIRI